MKKYRPSAAQLRLLKSLMPENFKLKGSGRQKRTLNVLLREGLATWGETRAFGIQLRIPVVTEAGRHVLALSGEPA